MGFMDKAKQMAEQAQQKIDDAQKQFNDAQAQRGQQNEQAAQRYDKHGRPVPAEAPPAAQTPAAPVLSCADDPPQRPRPRRKPRPRGAGGATRQGRRERHPGSVQADRVSIGGILTATVTPFDGQGRLDEDASADLVRHLLDTGSDGVVLAGTTGEGSTLTDDEDVGLWELGVEIARGQGATVIAGTGTNDTRHTSS